MSSLNNLLTNQKLFMSVIETAQGEMSEAQSLELKTLEQELVKKPDAIAGVLDNFESSIELLSKKKKEIDAALKSLKAQYERLEQYTIDSLLNANLVELEGNEIVLKISPTAGELEITDQAQAEKLYGVEEITIKVSKDAIKKDLNSGVDLGVAKIKQNYSLKRRIIRSKK